MNTVFLFLNLGGGEIVLILLVVLLLFGGKGIPTIARTLGKSVREFKDAASGIQRDLQKSVTQIDDEVHEKVQEIKRDLESDLDIKSSQKRDEEIKP